jgi:hypothetical protein
MACVPAPPLSLPLDLGLGLGHLTVTTSILWNSTALVGILIVCNWHLFSVLRHYQ